MPSESTLHIEQARFTDRPGETNRVTNHCSTGPTTSFFQRGSRWDRVLETVGG